ncbi:MAG: 23S rRNA (adenine(2503)-C(2))-methyltransferase RlmN, partial [Sulfurimonas sp.]
MNQLKPSLMDFTLKELQEIVKPSFRAKQIYGWLYHQYASNYEEMKNIPKAMKEELEKEYLVNPLKIVNKEESSDGTIKYLLELQDGKTMEAVWLKMKEEQHSEDG